MAFTHRQAKLEEPLIIRPTSETIIWTMYKKWIDSYRCELMHVSGDPCGTHGIVYAVARSSSSRLSSTLPCDG